MDEELKRIAPMIIGIVTVIAFNAIKNIFED